MIYAISLLLSFSVLLLGYALYVWMTAPSVTYERWNREVGIASYTPEDLDVLTRQKTPPRGLRRITLELRRLIRFREEDLFTFRRLLEKIDARQYQAEDWAAFRYVTVMGLPLFLWFFTGFSLNPLMILVLGIAAWLGWRLPLILLQRRAKTRVLRMERDLMDFLDLLNITAQSYANIVPAMEFAAQKRPGELSKVMMDMVRRIQLGQPLEDVFLHAAELYESEDLSAFLGAVVQGIRLGTPITDILRHQSESLRVRRLHRVEEAAGKTSVKIIIPLVFAVFLPMLLLVGYPILSQFGKLLGS
ncbi:MAG: type II secretion system F family protein [Clostridiales bacterium]|nr:type II secretion system F family protein [Clostridiales bacterium]